MLSDKINTVIVNHVGTIVYLVLVGILMFSILIIGARILHLTEKKKFGLWTGFTYGVLISAWSSACWLLVPYLGLYPNVPWHMLVDWIVPGADWHSWTPHVMGMAFSVMCWALAGVGMGLLGNKT
jgi:hypothetical protein